MGWLQVGLVGSIIFGFYYLQQIKITLKGRGHDVSMFTGWLADYRQFKQLAKDETDDRLKAEYAGILRGLYLSLAGLVVISYLLYTGK